MEGFTPSRCCSATLHATRAGLGTTLTSFFFQFFFLGGGEMVTILLWLVLPFQLWTCKHALIAALCVVSHACVFSFGVFSLLCRQGRRAVLHTAQDDHEPVATRRCRRAQGRNCHAHHEVERKREIHKHTHTHTRQSFFVCVNVFTSIFVCCLLSITRNDPLT